MDFGVNIFVMSYPGSNASIEKNLVMSSGAFQVKRFGNSESTTAVVSPSWEAQEPWSGLAGLNLNFS